jgi:hypothetical protein
MAESLRLYSDLEECIYPMKKEDMPKLSGDAATYTGREMYGEYGGFVFKALMPDTPKPESLAMAIGKPISKFEILNVPADFKNIEDFVLHVVATTVLNKNQSPPAIKDKEL